MESSHDGSMEEQGEEEFKDDNTGGKDKQKVPIAAYHPDFGLVKI